MTPSTETDAGTLIEPGLFVEAIPLGEIAPAIEPGPAIEVETAMEPALLVEAPAKAARPRGKGRAKPAAEAAPAAKREKPISRILQLIAALKAEQEAPPAERKSAPVGIQAPIPADEPAEPISVLSSLRDILVAREQERGEWEERARSLEGELIEARAAARAARDAAAQTEAQHRRVVADLKLLHEHQRSIWQLERRRLEITIEGFESERQKKIVKRAARLARPALVVGLMIILAALAILSGHIASASGDTRAGTSGAPHSASAR